MPPDVRPGPPDWSRVDTVLLDMDGTLLDRHFDDHFWEEFVPRRYAEDRSITLEEARQDLLARYKSREGTLAWYDLDFWSEDLGLDIPVLKRQVDHLIAIHPDVLPFLGRLRETGRTVALVTNAHAKTVGLKMEKTLLRRHFDAIVTSHEVGFPKETPAFWERLGDLFPFDPARTLLAEDTLEVLDAAASFGVAHLVMMAKPSSSREARPSGRYHSILTFAEIMPEGGPG